MKTTLIAVEIYLCRRDNPICLRLPLCVFCRASRERTPTLGAEVSEGKGRVKTEEEKHPTGSREEGVPGVFVGTPKNTGRWRSLDKTPENRQRRSST